LHAYLARTTAGPTGCRSCCPVAAPLPSAGRAGNEQRGHADFHGGAAHRIFQGNIQGVAQIRAALGAAATAATAAENVAEHIAKDVREAAAAKPPPAHLALNPGVAKLVISRTFSPSAQDFIGLGGLLELLLGIRILRIAVRMILHRDPAIGLLDFFLVRAALLTPSTS
jgi:hypothetical protein